MIDVKTQGHGRAVGVFRYLEVTKRVLVARECAHKSEASCGSLVLYV